MKKYELTDKERRAVDAASVALCKDGEHDITPESLYTELIADVPDDDSGDGRAYHLERKLQAACEIAIGWCKMAQNAKIDSKLDPNSEFMKELSKLGESAPPQRSDCIAECTTSLMSAIQQAGGTVSKRILDMSVGEFVTQVAAQNNIRFTYDRK